MPIFTQTIADPEVTQIPAFIDARFPGQERLMETSWNNKVARLEMPGLTQIEFDQLILDMTAAFPGAMTADNEFDIPIIVTPSSAAVIWTNMPAALTEFLGLTIHRTRAHLGARTQAQLIANVQTAGVAGSGLRVEASLNNGVAWRALEASPAVGPQVAIDAVGVVSSTAITIDAAVRKDVLLRVVGGGGNGIIDPAFGTILLRVR
jgi:hypothetical protein